MATRQQFDHALEELRQKIFELGSRVEERIGQAVDSLAHQDLEQANTVVVGDLEINDLQGKIEEKCILLIATQQPVSSDLRKVVAGFKISMYLERMSDLAVDLAKLTLRIGHDKLIKPLIDIPRMAVLVREMIKTGLQSYVHEDVEAAQKMALTDDEVDHLYAQIFRELLVIMMQDPKTINQANHLIFAGRFLERMGDYCTNIAEETVYIVTAKRSDLNE